MQGDFQVAKWESSPPGTVTPVDADASLRTVYRVLAGRKAVKRLQSKSGTWFSVRDIFEFCRARMLKFRRSKGCLCYYAYVV